ncbi:MAG: pitrilysin family protein [Chitinophagaceae bacterium]
MKKIVLIAAAFMAAHFSFAQIDRSKPPKAGAAPVITIADPVIFKLANGMTVLVVENHKLPSVRAALRIDAGPVTEGSKAGLLSIMGGMLSEGTIKKTKAQFDEAVDLIGADVSLSAGGGSVSALTRYFDQAFLLMAEGLRYPSFPQESFDKLISQEITGLKTIEKSASRISGRVVDALAFGVHHPQGEFETEASVKSLTLDDIKAAYKKYITPARTYLTFVGDISPAAARALAEKAFGDWKGYPLKLETLQNAQNPGKTEINVVDVPNAVQAEITIVNLVNIPMSSPDYFPVLLANKILGGGADARLFMNLREKHGFTYGAYSNIGSGRFQSTFAASASVRNEKADSAVREFLYEINQMRTGQVSPDELANAKSQYNGSFALGMENTARIADFASNILINGLPANFYRTYLQKINAVTVADIQRVAKKYFNYDNTRVVVVGKQSQIVPGLKALGYPVKFYDKYAAPVEENANAAAKTTITPAQIVDSYIKAIGGREALAKVNSVLSTGKMEIMGQSLDATMRQMAPNKELLEISMAGQAVMKMVYDGTTGYQMQMGQKQDMDSADLNKRKAVKGLFEQLYYNDGRYKLEVKGMEKSGNANVYVLAVTLPSGDTRTEYYDVTSGLLVKTAEAKETEGMQITQTTEFADYKKVGDVSLPYKLSTSVSTPMGAQEFVIVLNTVKVNEGVTAADFK